MLSCCLFSIKKIITQKCDGVLEVAVPIFSNYAFDCGEFTCTKYVQNSFFTQYSNHIFSNKNVPKKLGKNCVLHESCGKCLAADVSCSWCTDSKYDARKARCMTKDDLLANSCSPNFIQGNTENVLQLLENRKLEDFTTDLRIEDVVQIQPQRAKLKLRKGQTTTIKMKYRPARNYPLDVYYLMDLTWSMRDDKETLVNVANDLANTLNNFSVNYKLGYGSFADKPGMPFIMTGKKDLENPCALEHEECEPTYSYRHRLDLTKNVQEFKQKVDGSDVTANLDNLEGGLDALMQVLVCQEKVSSL